MSSRYDKRNILINSHPQYKESFLNRGINQIRQFETATFRYPIPEEINDLNIIGHIYKTNDRLWKLSQQYYNNSEYWYLICLYNKIPNETLIKVGDVIYIPLPLEKVLRIFNL